MRIEFLKNKTPLYLIALFFSFLVPFIFLEDIARFPRGLMTDDSYFYMNIAYNIGTNGFSTFDGINPTDGYHLLWCWILAGVSFLLSLFTTEKTIHLAVMLGTYLFLCCFIGIYFTKKTHHFFYFFFFGIIFKMMMDSTLVALLLLLFLYHFFVFTKKPAHPAWMIALLLLIPLARVDATLFIFVLSFYYLVIDKKPSQFLFINAVMAMGVLLHFLGMWLTAGSYTSVSAELKTAGVWNIADNLTANILTASYYSGLILLSIFLAFLSISLLIVARMKDSGARKKCYFILLSATGFIVLHLCTNNSVRYWYYIPSLFMLLYVLVNVSDSNKFIRIVAAVVPIIAIGAFCLKYILDSEIRANEIKYSRYFVQNVKKYVPVSEPIYQIDASGYVGTFSERIIINGDGLVNTHAYARKLISNQLGDYLSKNNILYVIHNQYPQNGIVLDYHGLKILEEDVETLIKPPAALAHTTAFGLYKLKLKAGPSIVWMPHTIQGAPAIQGTPAT